MSVLAGLGLASYMSGRRAVPSWAGMAKLRGLQSTVEVVRDRWGVPAIYAQTDADLFFAQGYIHASDRMFQMDLLRRMATGSLSQVVGESTVNSDKLMRMFGFGAAAREDFTIASVESRAALTAYADGVNRYLSSARGKLPVEFRILGYKPAPWRPHHGLLSWRLMAFGLCGNWEAELARAEIQTRFGPEVLSALDDEVQAHAFPAAISEETLGALRSALRSVSTPFGGGPGVGSNNWALGSRRTASGAPIIANDPHLELQLPSVWFENRLQSESGEGFSVRGFSIPGSPSVILGHNGTVSWSFTNSCADVQDLYVEELDEDGRRYRDVNGEWMPLQSREEKIHVARSDSLKLAVRSTRRGPIISDCLSIDSPTPVSLRWHGMQPSRMVDAMLGMGRATDWEQFRDAVKLWSAPAQNLIYADVHGNIAYQHIGTVPVRAGHDGSVPLAGTDPRGEWTGVVPFEDLPYSLNPGVDRLVTANDKIVDDNYPHFISREWMNGYRAERIRSLIDAGRRHTVADQLAIQADVHSIVADQLIPLLASRVLAPLTGEGKAVWKSLQDWNHELTPKSEGGAAWRAFMRALNDEVYGFLGDLQQRYLGYSRSGVNGFWSLFGRTTPRLIAALRSDDRTLFQLAAKQPVTSDGPAGWSPSATWDEALSRALDRAGMAMATSGPRGKSAHRVRLQHPLGVLPILKAVANARTFAAPGDPDTVWQASAFENPGNPHAMVGPSHRSVIDLANLDQSVAVLAGGQSGHPASPHYLDQLEMWRSGRARPAPWSRAAIEVQAAYHQVLEPA